MASGNVMKIPLSAIQEKQEEHFNLSHEVNRSGLWKHIESQPSLGRLANGSGKENT